MSMIRSKPEITIASTIPINEILKMDGRKAAPRVCMWRPFPVSAPNVASVKRTIKEFIKNGESGFHSQYGVLLRYIVAYCEENGIGYQLTCSVYEGRTAGYYIMRYEL